jgi:hypothetical protein
MKRLFLLLIIGIFFVGCGCTSYEVLTEIHPEVTIVGDIVGIRYE